MPTCTPALRVALNQSISSGRFTDTKIVLYSRRNASGIISKPKPLYANSYALKSVPYFSDLLSGVYAESEPKDFSEAIDEDECAKNYDYHSDSDLEDDEDVTNARNITEEVTPPESVPVPADLRESEPVHGEWNDSPGEGTIIKIHDIAFITFQAFLMYLYTGHLEFAPYGSEENRRSRSAEIISCSDASVPRPSPKSIYRLADKYDIPLLKQLALDNIRSGVEQCDIVEQLFSKFSSNYEDARKMFVNHLASVLPQAHKDFPKDVWKKFNDKIDSYANGDLDHAVDTMALLWKLSKARGSPLPGSPDEDEVSHPEPTPAPANWERVEVALIKSIRKGIFFDKKYWTRRSKTGSALRPVYVSSTIAGEYTQRINDLVQMHPEGGGFGTDVGSGDSDCENSSEQVSGSAPEVKDDRKEEVQPEPLPLLPVGSFASWRSLFFYLYTNTIQFAPLRSQGVDERALFVQEKTIPGLPPPCSPKVTYTLAKALGIKTLRSLAFKDIRSKLTAANIITEFFSGFTSRQNDIAKMQSELLYGEFNNDTTTADGIEFIESMLGGNLARCVGALKRGLIEGGVLPAPDPDQDQSLSDTEPLTPPRPRTIAHRGMIQVNNASSGRFMGYISTLSKNYFTFGSDPSTALDVNFDTDLTGTGTNLNINIGNWVAGFPLMGLARSGSDSDSFLGQNRWTDYVYLTGVESPGTTPNSAAVKLASAHKSSSPVESAVWTVDASGRITPHWTNPDGSRPTIQLFAYNKQLYAGSSLPEFIANVGSITIVEFKYIALEY